MIEIKNLKFEYTKNIEILNNLNIELNSGQIHGLVGLNGSGKTTLLNLIYKNLQPQEGEILFNKKNIVKNDIAFLETESFFYPKITGGEYLEIFKFGNKNFDFKAWNEIFDLPLNKLVDNYSTGMKKKLAFISLMSFENPIYILDEPFNGIDLESNQILKNVILKLKSIGKTIIITSHIFDILMNICDSISFLNNKKIEFTKYKNEFDEIEKLIFQKLDKDNNLLLENLIK